MQQGLNIPHDEDVDMRSLGMTEDQITAFNNGCGKAIGIKAALASLKLCIIAGNVPAIKLYLINVAGWKDKTEIIKTSDKSPDWQAIDVSKLTIEELKIMKKIVVDK